MRVIYSSLHNIDLSAENPVNKVIPEDFDSYMESYIRFAATENPSSREYTEIDHNYTVVNCIKQIYSLAEYGYERPTLQQIEEGIEDRILPYVTTIARKLLQTEKMVQDRMGHFTNVQKGSIVQALIEDEGVYKFVIAKVEHSEWIDGETFQKNFGFPSENRIVWKSASFCLEAVDGNIIFTSIKSYVNNNAIYWTNEFLEVKEANSDTKNTKAALSAVEAVLRPLKIKSPQDYYNLKNSAIRELQTDQIINYPDMVGRLLDNYSAADETIDTGALKNKMLSQSEGGKFDTQFHADPNVVKRNKKIIFKVSPCIDLVIKESLPNWRSNFRTRRNSDGSSYLIIECNEPETLEAFPLEQ